MRWTQMTIEADKLKETGSGLRYIEVEVPCICVCRHCPIPSFL